MTINGNNTRPSRAHQQLVLPGILLATCFLGASLATGTLVGKEQPIPNAGYFLLKHCSSCHIGSKPKGGFNLDSLGDVPNVKSLELWETSLAHVRTGIMPPPKHDRLIDSEKAKFVSALQKQLDQFYKTQGQPIFSPRRLNNRELANSIADVLMIEDVGTNFPIANLLGDNLHHGFDTNPEALGMSEFHLEQYITAIRRIVDSTIIAGEQPDSTLTRIPTNQLRTSQQGNRLRAEKANRTPNSIEILDVRNHVYFENFPTVPFSGRYRLQIKATGIDRNVYGTRATGHFKNDPIIIRVHLGDRKRDFELPDNEVATLELNEWLSAGTKIEVTYHTDALRLEGNGNFKFQYRIAHDYIQKNDPKLYKHVVTNEVPKAKTRSTAPGHWMHWQKYWQGPRPRFFSAEVEGPFYEQWPPIRQTKLLTQDTSANRALEILMPIAQRAWRRVVTEQELAPYVQLVQQKAKTLGDIPALKEGIVAILSSPSFLILYSDSDSSTDKFASKLSYVLNSAPPDSPLSNAVKTKRLNSAEDLLQELHTRIESGKADAFIQQFPYAWLQLDRINFMAPDPERYPLYHRKQLSDDMIQEVLIFFRHAIENNIEIPELLTTDYSFINSDLAAVYGIEDEYQSSQFHQHHFSDGRRGGFLGMGAFHTLTADSLTTSPIHRAVYVLENFLGTTPTPPPGDIEIQEPDVRQAKTIKEILNAHKSDASCASCHQRIDPYGYAFENFDPIGAWRDKYTEHLQSQAATGRPIPVDATASFVDGRAYSDIREFREIMQSEFYRQQFVRCFITKVLEYANGDEPKDHSELDRLVTASKALNYRIVDTLALVLDSPLFRGP